MSSTARARGGQRRSHRAHRTHRVHRTRRVRPPCGRGRTTLRRKPLGPASRKRSGVPQVPRGRQRTPAGARRRHRRSRRLHPLRPRRRTDQAASLPRPLLPDLLGPPHGPRSCRSSPRRPRPEPRDPPPAHLPRACWKRCAQSKPMLPSGPRSRVRALRAAAPRLLPPRDRPRRTPGRGRKRRLKQRAAQRRQPVHRPLTIATRRPRRLAPRQ